MSKSVSRGIHHFWSGTWYRPPSSPPDLFGEFEKIIAKIDAENIELYILGDVNCNLLPETNAHISSFLANIFDIYGLIQLIREPTRVTSVSSTLILSDLNQMPWANVDAHSDPNDLWREWKEMFLSCVDKHAPLKSKRVRNKRCPWITGDLLCKTRRRDFLKKTAISSHYSAAWDQYKRARNQANNSIKLANKIYVSDMEPN